MAPVLRPAELARYADALVRVAAAIRRGDVLIVAAEPGHRELCTALVEASYRAGAKYAEVQYVTPSSGRRSSGRRRTGGWAG